MSRLSRARSFLVDAARFALRAALFTVAATIVVGVAVLFLRAALVFGERYTGSGRVAGLLAIAVFVLYIAVPTYLLAVRTDDPEATGGDDHGKL